ncbi:hypothetical protein AVEN_138928-1 [Araneus ventricosus]|uniref:Uncharacterized protein n=1 Tax=Araneus ventricosus TaxID=182803 RepID=A0A4Y2KAV9_ARAVE|nr:hypothetical protein AVEN_138928-1 [Araneus ventricosus]
MPTSGSEDFRFETLNFQRSTMYVDKVHVKSGVEGHRSPADVTWKFGKGGSSSSLDLVARSRSIEFKKLTKVPKSSIEFKKLTKVPKSSIEFKKLTKVPKSSIELKKLPKVPSQNKFNKKRSKNTLLLVY